MPELLTARIALHSIGGSDWNSNFDRQAAWRRVEQRMDQSGRLRAFYEVPDGEGSILEQCAQIIVSSAFVDVLRGDHWKSLSGMYTRTDEDRPLHTDCLIPRTRVYHHQVQHSVIEYPCYPTLRVAQRPQPSDAQRPHSVHLACIVSTPPEA